MKIEASALGLSIVLALSMMACGGTKPPAEAPVQSEASISAEVPSTESSVEIDVSVEKDAPAAGSSTAQDKMSDFADAVLADSTYHYEAKKVGSFKDAKRDVRSDGEVMGHALWTRR